MKYPLERVEATTSMEEKATEDSTSRDDSPAWVQTGAPDTDQAWQAAPPPPPGAELEPGEQGSQTISREQQTGEVSGFRLQGITAEDAEMGAEAAPAAIKASGSTESRTGFDAPEFQTRWQSIQASFVDDPRAAVRAADGFFDELLGQLQQERDGLRSVWSGDQGSTEDLRVAMQRYRDYFKRWTS